MPIPQHPNLWPLSGNSWSNSKPPEQDNHPGPQQPFQVQSGPVELENAIIAELKERTPDQQPAASSSLREGTPCTDRGELIERIKRGESPKWIPSEALQREYMKGNGIPIYRPLPSTMETLPVFRTGGEIGLVNLNEMAQEQSRTPPDIERPPSALHAGDFKELSGSSEGLREGPDESGAFPPLAGGLPGERWCPPSPSLVSFQGVAPWAFAPLPGSSPFNDQTSLGSFSSSSYVLKKPTTPLIQQSNNTDLDFPGRDLPASPEKPNRRHTLPPHAASDWRSPSIGALTSASPPKQLPPNHRREASFPRSHQGRRSITSTWSLQQPSSPPTSTNWKSCRTSFSSEASSGQRASMVGSYEESILNGRMSTAPSKPFDFHAQIGVLGRGKRPKMPPHITVPFLAVFYDWSSNTRQNTVYDEPSPYVGDIDFQNLEKSPADIYTPEGTTDAAATTSQHELSPTQCDGSGQPTTTTLHPSKRKWKDVTAPPGGSYRIPEQGQVQVIVRNSYKTALKLFLIPYDLAGMEPGQKTFVRQRYYSTGPIIDRPIIAEAGSGPLSHGDRKKPTLRYLIHLKMCCPTKGHYFLYGNIRVVFANRVPDDKEHLAKELQEPDPKYSQWKPHCDSSRTPTPFTKHASDPVFRRRSSGFTYNLIAADGCRSSYSTGPSFSYADTDAPPVPPIPFHLWPPTNVTIGSETHTNHDRTDPNQSRPNTSSDEHFTVTAEERTRNERGSSDSGESDTYAKLNKGDAGYGGFFHRAASPEPGSGLLARRLRCLEVQREPRGENTEEF